MAREKALNIADYLNDEVNANLAETMDGVLGNVYTSSVSEGLKSKRGSGDPTSGSTEYKRFANAELKDKGTARRAGKGVKVKEKPVTVNIDTDKEIVEELQGKDIKLYGIDGMIEKRKNNIQNSIVRYLDREFFAEAVNSGTKIERGTLTKLDEILDKAIVDLKSLSNDFIDGIDAEDLAIVLSTKARKEFKNKLDELPNGTAPQNGAIGMYDSIVVHESHRMPEGTNFIVMLKESIAQPFYVTDFDAEKIPLDDAYAVQSFLYKGTKALIDEAILYDADEVTPSV